MSSFLADKKCPRIWAPNPKGGGGRGCGVSANEYSCAHGALLKRVEKGRRNLCRRWSFSASRELRDGRMGFPNPPPPPNPDTKYRYISKKTWQNSESSMLKEFADIVCLFEAHPERQERGGVVPVNCWNREWMETQRVKMRGVLPWLIRGGTICCASQSRKLWITVTWGAPLVISAFSFIWRAHIGARALHAPNYIWFDNSVHLSQWGGGGLFLRSNVFYLTSLRVEEWEGWGSAPCESAHYKMLFFSPRTFFTLLVHIAQAPTWVTSAGRRAGSPRLSLCIWAHYPF